MKNKLSLAETKKKVKDDNTGAYSFFLLLIVLTPIAGFLSTVSPIKLKILWTILRF